MQAEGFYPFNSSYLDPNVRGEAPEGQEVHRDVTIGAFVAGVKAVDVPSQFGLGLGEVWGITLLDNSGAGANEILSAKVAASSTAGKVTVTIQSSDATATDNLVRSFVLCGRILPVDA